MSIRRLALLLLLVPAALYGAISSEVSLAAGGSPAIASSDSKALVVFGARAIFVDREARPLGAPFTIAAEPPDAYPGVASDGSSFLVAWVTRGEVRAAFVRDDGAVEPLPPIARGAVLSYGERVNVAFDGARWFVFWKDEIARAAAVSPAGMVEATLSFPDLKYIGGASGDPSRLVVLGWSDFHGVIGAYAATVDAALNVRPATLIAGETLTIGSGSPYVTSPAIAPFGGGYLAAWIRGRTSRRNEVQATRLTADVQPLDVTPSTHAPLSGTSGREIHATGQSAGDHHTDTRLSRAGEGAVIGWALETGGEEAGIWASFIDRDGSPSLIGAIAVRGRFDPQSLHYPQRFDVAGFPDGHAIVVYERSGTIFARAVTAASPRRRAAGR